MSVPRSGWLVIAALALAGIGFRAAASPTVPTGNQSPFGIDYSQPGQYVAPGRQTLLTQADLAELAPALLPRVTSQPTGLEQLAGVFEWLRGDFESWNAGGSTIGAATARELLESKRLGGCHDFALVFAAVTRGLGYPAVMVDTAGLDWLKTAATGAKGRYTGHVFVEVFVDGHWILVDATNGPYVAKGYDPGNPVIPLGRGYYAMRKGADTWGYGINSNQQLQQLMDETAKQLAGVAFSRPPYEIQKWMAVVAPPRGDEPTVEAQDWPCRGEPTLDAKGRMKACTLAREYIVVGTRLPAGTVIHFSEGSPKTCTLGAEATVAGFRLPAATEVGFDLGRLRYAKLAQTLTVRGNDFPAGSRIYFQTIWMPDIPGAWHCALPAPMVIQGHLCARGENLGQFYYPSGKLRATWLAADEEIDGVPCTTSKSVLRPRTLFYGLDTMVWFFENGRLQQAMLSRDCTLQGRVFKAANIVRLNADGTLDTTGETLGASSRK